jgi:hypothetical protein
MRVRAIAVETIAATEPVAVPLASTGVSPVVAASERRAQLVQLGIVNPLVGRFQISQFATPLEHGEAGWVTRIMIAADCLPANSELRSPTKDALKDALSRSRLEEWVSDHVADQKTDGGKGWALASPNSGYIVTFKRDWGMSANSGSHLLGKATLQLPSGTMSGPRVVIVLDVIERQARDSSEPRRLRLSLAELHELLHSLATTTVDQLGSVVFPLTCEDPSPRILGPNYELSFGDRSLNTTIQIPADFSRPSGAHDLPWATINTLEDVDAHDLVARDSVLRQGIESMLRQNEYDGIEAEIAGLSMPGASSLAE